MQSADELRLYVYCSGLSTNSLEELSRCSARFTLRSTQREYLTYCTNDSRGMAAAFLLSTQGFKARTLRGGLSAWDGPVASGLDCIHMPKASS